MKKNVLITVLVFAATTLLTISVYAQPYEGVDAPLELAATELVLGDPVPVTAAGFAPRSPLTVELRPTVDGVVVDPSDEDPLTLDEVTADDDGAIDVDLELPETLPTGEYLLSLSGVSPDGATFVLGTVVTVEDAS